MSKTPDPVDGLKRNLIDQISTFTKDQQSMARVKIVQLIQRHTSLCPPRFFLKLPLCLRSSHQRRRSRGFERREETDARITLKVITADKDTFGIRAEVRRKF